MHDIPPLVYFGSSYLTLLNNLQITLARPSLGTPPLKREVDAAFESFKRNLGTMGTYFYCRHGRSPRQRLNIANVDLQPRVFAILSGEYDRKYLATFKDNSIPSSECNCPSKLEILRQITRYKGNDLPGFVSFVTKKIVNANYLDSWSVTEEHVLKIHDHLPKTLSLFISHIADPSAYDVFTHIFE
ncbi:MAG: hypothetical protein J3R72DRAFT_473267 [Linnemannia gamsii]|nr:MAG: hypothetical protein J3R72DRAFT_473267 [Linnemannia gamsii]